MIGKENGPSIAEEDTILNSNDKKRTERKKKVKSWTKIRTSKDQTMFKRRPLYFKTYFDVCVSILLSY